MENEKIILTFPNGMKREYDRDLIGDALFDAVCWKTLGIPFTNMYDDIVSMLLAICGDEDIKVDLPEGI